MIANYRGSRGIRAVLGAVVLSLVLPASSPLDAQLGAARSRWWSDVDRLGGMIEAGKWKKAAKQAEDLREQVMRSSWREPDLAEVLAEIAFQLAVARANQDEDDLALWEWHTALNLEAAKGRRGIAERDLTPYGRATDLLAAHPLRAYEEYPPGYPDVEVRPDRDYEHPEQREDFQIGPLTNTAATREVVDPVTVEVLIDAQGRVHQPVLVTSWSHPVTVQWALDNLRRSAPFRPARMNGEPVAVLRAIEFHVGDANRLEGESWDIH
jgi:hypothetical protein